LPGGGTESFGHISSYNAFPNFLRGNEGQEKYQRHRTSRYKLKIFYVTVLTIADKLAQNKEMAYKSKRK
jgi:hypothetical protein